MAVPVTLLGPNFDISYDDAVVGLFGTPTLVGNQVSWFPSGSPGFTAQTGSGFGVTNSTFALKVTAHPGYTLSSFSLSEGGDYFYFGTGSFVTVSGQLRVTPLPGSTSSSAIAATGPFVANTFDISNPSAAFATRNWVAAAAPLGVPGGATAVNVSIQNILASGVTPGTLGYAFIEKKDVFLTVDILATVPEPGTYGMMGAGLGLVAFLAMRRRRRG